MKNKNLFVVLSLIGIAFISRFLPHPPNFTAVGAIALFAGAHIKESKLALFIPLAAMILSDVILGFHSTQLVVYLCFILIGLIGNYALNKPSLKLVGFASLASSGLFFIVTNFAVWAFGTMYEKTLNGLLTCYLMAIPFFWNTLIGDLFYNTLLFGTFYYLTQTKLIKQKV